MAFTEDLTEFFSTDDFAVSATYSGGGTVSGIFDNQFLGVPGEPVMSGSQPTFTVKTADVPTVTTGQTFVIASVTYTVTGIHPDGTGVTMLLLRK